MLVGQRGSRLPATRVAEDLKTFSDFLLYELQAMPFVATVRSNILLEQMKATTVLPLPSHPDQE